MKQLLVRFEGELEPRTLRGKDEQAVIIALGKEMEQHAKAWPFRRTMLGATRTGQSFLIMRPAPEMDYPHDWAVEYGVLGILDSTVSYGPHSQAVITFMRRARLFVTEAESATTDNSGGPSSTERPAR